MTIINRTDEEKNINKIILLGSTFVILVVSLTLAYILINLQIQDFKINLKTFKNTIIQREKFTLKTTVKNLVNEISYEKKAQTLRIKQNIKNQTIIAFNLAESIYTQNKSKNKIELINLIKKAIKSISTSENNINYFMLNNKGKLVLNTQASKNEGEYFKGFVDINGKKFIDQMIEKSKTKDKFVDYLWYKPNSSRISKKITYSKYLSALDIIIGSGSFINTNYSLFEKIGDKIKKQSFGKDEFLFAYKVNSLSNPKKSSKLILEKNIKTTDKELDVLKKVLIASNYQGNIFFNYEKKLIYATFLQDIRTFVAVGTNLEHINEIIKNETVISNKNLNKKIVSLIISMIFIMIIFFIISYIISMKIERIFKKYRLKVINNERKYQLLFNHSNDAFIISKITKDKKALIISTNLIAKNISGYFNDLIGKNFFELFVNFDVDNLLSKKEILITVLMQTKQNEIKYIELSSVVYKDGEEILLFSSLRDISERISIKREKDKQQKLLIQKSKMASMGEMIGNIAHQWRQPLSQLSGLFFDIESAYDYGVLNKKYLSSRIDEANDLVEYMSKTIDDFKEFYNPNIKKERFNINDNIQKVFNMIASSLKFHNIEITSEVDNNIFITGLTSEFSQVILNILSNAKESALRRNIKEPKIKVFSENKKNKILLHVEDNCGGIKEEILNKIFEPYFTTKYNYGTGVGLYMSKIIIENKMNGKIFAKNVDKNKSRFTIILGL